MASSFAPIIFGSFETTSDLPIGNTDDFDSKIKDIMELAHFPSLACCIVKNNATVFSEAYGLADMRILHRKNATTDTVYPMGSISKSIAATSIMILNESGKLNLDENISKYLPFDFKNPKYPNINITARMLLAHQSSLKSLGALNTLISCFNKDSLGWLEKHLKRKNAWFEYAPGENVSYATIDINILGYVIQNITGKSYSEFVEEKIFQPLKMYNTSYYLSDFDKSQVVRQYVWFNSVYLRAPFLPITEIMFPGGGARSTVNDMSHYLIMHTSGGVYDGVRILNKSSIDEMHRAQYSTLDEGHSHGLGWYFINYTENVTTGGHDGTHVGAYAVMKMRYSDNVGVLFFYNQHSWMAGTLGKTPQEEKDARNMIREALFEKSDEY